MPIANYTDLKASVARWMNRTDLTDDIPDFIRSAESQIAIDLRLRQQLCIAQLSTTAGVNGIALPEDFLEFDSVGMNGRELEQISFGELVRNRATGTPRNYAIGGNELLLSTQADGAYPVNVTYFARFPALEDVPVNGLLLNYPDVYLFASLMWGFRFVMNEAAAAQWQGQYIGLKDRLMGADKRALYSGSSLRTRPR
jgi:hypothetical protein